MKGNKTASERFRGCPAIAFGTKNFASFWIKNSICLSFSPDFELLDGLFTKEIS